LRQREARKRCSRREDAHLQARADELLGVVRDLHVGRQRWSHALGSELYGRRGQLNELHSRQEGAGRTLNMALMKPSPSHGREPASISMQMHPSDQMSALAE